MTYQNLTGNKYGKLTVVCLSKDRLYNRTTWKCRCDCGIIKLATSTDLQLKKVTTCGNSTCKAYNTKAANKAKTTHNRSHSRLYKIWAGMKKRCNNSHPRYGAIGITYDSK